ncbi:S8 family serine peptidase [Longispora sp. NPDC051575]|uniref:S8 family serine peptidase n=1 Tax=Longispora sp. NPDC051575 TaxID=3154943 RepID=UPI0034144842
MPRRVAVLTAAFALALPLAVMAVAVPASADPGAPAAASKIPSLVADRVAQIRAAVGTNRGLRGGGLSDAQRDTLSAGYLTISPAGGIDLTLHATGPVGKAEEQALRDLGATVVRSSAEFAKVPGVTLPEAGLVHAVVPYDKVDAVAGLGWVATLRPTLKPQVDSDPQLVAEAVPLHRTDVANSRGFTGKGQKVGFISDGVSSLAEAIARGELPADSQALAVGDGDEGTAMMEITHDMAPDAKLAFHTVGEDLTSYVAAFHALAASGANLIAEDIAFDDEPAFQQGLGAETAEKLAQQGIWVSSSAGNLGAKHATRAPAVGTGRTPDGVAGSYANCPTAPRNTVNLRGADNTYDVIIRPGGAILPTLQWSEPRAIYPTIGQGGFTNLNLYLMKADGSDCLASSTNVQANGVGDSIEQLIFENTTGANIPAKIVVDVAGSSSAVKIPTFDLRWRTALVTAVDPGDRAGSLNPDSNYLGFATSAGAVASNVSTDPATTPLESYSAAGPVQIGSTTVCATGVGPCTGVAGGGFRSFVGPAWAAADGVTVSGVGGFGSGTCPSNVQGGCRFFGTSAAAPSAAGVAALIREQIGASQSPLTVNRTMYALALKRAGNPGFGAGVLRATTY